MDEEVKRMMAKVGITQSGIADRAGLRQSQVSKILTGKQQVSHPIARRIEAAFAEVGLGADDLQTLRRVLMTRSTAWGITRPMVEKFRTQFRNCNGNLPPAVRDWLEGRA